MDALHHYMLRGADFVVGKIPDAADAAAHQPVGHPLGRRHGDGQQSHADRRAAQVVLQLVRVDHGDAGNRRADQLRVHVEGGQKLKAVGVEFEVFNQGAAQVAGPQDHDGVALVDPQNAADLLPEAFDLIAVALLTEAAEAEQVLPDLGGGQPHGFAQRAGGNAFHAFLLKLEQVPVIPGQTADHGGRYFGISFHVGPPFHHWE